MTVDGIRLAAPRRLGARRRRARLAGHLAATLALAGAAFVASIAVGELTIPPADVLLTLLGGGRSEHAFVVLDLRLPRVTVALAVGAALGAAGAIFQGVTRNALAAPEIVGVAAGANVAAVLVIVVLPAAPVALLPPTAFAGAVAATALVYALSRRRTGTSPARLVLVGIGVSAAAQAVVIAAVSTVDEVIHASQLVIFTTGSVYAKGWADLWAMVPWLVVLLPAALLAGRQLDVLALGDDVAGGLGMRVERARAGLLLIGAGLAGVAVAVAGPVGFVGLIAPHMARRLTGVSHATVVPLSALLGGTLLIVADLLARTLFAPVDLPVGVMTAVVGAPYFLVLLHRTRTA
jgi:iron complex transport system permease protein